MPVPDYVRAIWRNPEPGRLMGPGHPAGDFLDGPDWRVVEESAGRLVVDVPLVPAVKNFRAQLFGGFAPAYIDLIALRTVSAGTGERAHGWLVTLNMNVEYFEPVEGRDSSSRARWSTAAAAPSSSRRASRAREGKLLLFATVTLLEQPVT